MVVDAAQNIQAQTISNLYLALENDLEIIPVTTVVEVLGVALTEKLQSIDWDFSDYENSDNLKSKKSSEVELPN